MVSSKRNGQIATPPYLSISKLSQLLNLVSTRRFDEIQPQDLVHYGFGETDSYIAVTALRFLGLIDQKNQAQETIKKLQLQGNAKTEALATTVRNAYAVIFERIQDPAALDPDELHNEFLITYGITPRVARAAVPAFIWLCEQVNAINQIMKDTGERNESALLRKLVDEALDARRKKSQSAPLTEECRRKTGND